MYHFATNRNALRLRCRRRPFENSRDGRVEFAFVQRLDDERIGVCTNLELTEQPLGKEVNPAFALEEREAQELMDSLWECGLRPTAGQGSAGQLEAVQKHLADMRRLAFAKLGVEETGK